MSEQPAVAPRAHWTAAPGDTSTKSGGEDLNNQPAGKGNIAPEAADKSKAAPDAVFSGARKQPQRKQSVFSFNGFPDASLLLEQHQPLKSRHTPADQDVSSVSPVGLATTAPAKECVAGPATGGSGAQTARVPQVRAMDNLGSTGSSRASSCDEPSLASTSESQSQQKVSIGSGGEEKRLESPLHIDGGSREPSSSGSSLDSSSSWCCDPVNESSGKAPAKTTSSEQQENESTTTTAAATCDPPEITAAQNNSQSPFEPVAIQLKQLNATPDPQLIQRYIDNLISENEAIMDNCNLISIRSYNSSQQQTAKRLSISATSADKSPSDTIARLSTAGGAAPKLSQQARSSKRWSTSGMPSGRANLCTINADRQPFDIVHNHTNETTGQSHQLDNHILKHITERKRSYNVPMPRIVAPVDLFGTNMLSDADGSLSSLHDSYQLPLKPRPSSTSKSPQPQPLDSTLELMLSLNETKQLLEQQRQQQPQQLEDAIQNLSLKRREEVLQQPAPARLLFDQLQPVDTSDMPTNSNINNNNKPLLHNNHQHHHRSYSITGQNLISEATALQKSSQDQQIMDAALLFKERFQQSLMEQQMSLENQALFHHQQQQMIEHQLEQFRFAVALEQHQLQLSSKNRATCSTKEELTQLGLLFPACNQTALSILKRQLLLVPQTVMAVDTGLATIDSAAGKPECSRPRESLPFKKRKISEPDIRH